MDAALQQRLAGYRAHHQRMQGQLQYEGQNIQRLKTKMTRIEQTKTQLLKAQALIDKAIGVISANGIGQIESLVTKGLRLIFGNHKYQFFVEKKEGARGVSYRLKLRKGDHEGEILDTFGGGVANVVSFLLRCMMIKRFKLAKFLVVDESFNNVSPQYQPKVSEFLRTLCDTKGYTILAVTHQAILARNADRAYEVIPLEDDPPVLVELTPEQIASLRETRHGLTSRSYAGTETPSQDGD